MARKNREEAAETREKLLESALETIIEHPFSKVSMNEIAEKVGLSKGAVYWHFKGRDDLLYSLLDSLSDLLSKDEENDAENMNSIDGVRDYFKNRLNMMARSERFQKVHRLMMRRYEWPEPAQEKVQALGHKKISREVVKIETALAVLQSRGEIRRDVLPKDLAVILVCVFHGILIAQLSETSAYDFSPYSDFVVRELLGVGARQQRSLNKKQNSRVTG